MSHNQSSGGGYAGSEPTADSQSSAASVTPTVRVTDVTELGLRMMLPQETFRLTNAHAYLCTSCGALVVDVKRHEGWHAENDATSPVWPCVSCGESRAERGAWCAECSARLGP